MNKFIKENWVKIVFGIIIVILGFSFIFSLPKAKQTEIVNQQNCSKKADEMFKEYLIKMGNYELEYNANNYNYENHYSSKMNGCFVLITDNTENNYSSVLYNVYENKELGGIYTAMQTAGLCGLQIGDSYKTCEHIGKEGQLFMAKEEFNNLAKVYMEN